MPAVVIALIGVAVVLLVVFIVVVSRRHERERTEELRRVAETAGLSFQPDADLEDVRSLASLDLFEHGHSKRVKNLMTGTLEELQVRIFDYRYTTGGGQHQQTHTQTVVLLPSLKHSLPDLRMSPEGRLHKVAEAFGAQDIDIESSPEFSQKYVVKGADEEAVRTALYPNATTYFADHPGWMVEVTSGSVAVYRASDRPKADEARTFIDDALAAARSL